MRKIVIVSYYEPKDYLIKISELFETKYQWKSIYYPLYMYCYDKFSKIDNYLDHYLEFLKKEKPDILLWWFTDVSLAVFNKVKHDNPNIFFILFNVSDPINLNKTYYDKCKIFDQVLTVCYNSIPFYKMYSNIKYIDFMPFCYDKELFKIYTDDEKLLFDKKFKADISFYCESLYQDQTEQLIDRKTIITTISDYCKKNNLIFNLYGAESLYQLAPDNYKGDLYYVNMPAVFSLSKINLVVHTNPKKTLALNNMLLFPIMATGGIVLMDLMNGAQLFFNKEKEIIFFYDQDNLIKSIQNIIDLYDQEPEKINRIKLNASEYVKNSSWDRMTDRIYLRYNSHYFDHESYIKNHNISNDDIKLSETDNDKKTKLFELWNKRFNEGKIEIPYSIKIPSNFDLDNYKAKLNLKNVSNEYIYIHWYMNGQNSDYMKRATNTSTSISGSVYSLPTTKLFDLFRGFNMMYSYRKIDQGLETLNRIAKQNPRLKINDALSKYIDITYAE